ncbi:MAG: hypothetical protein D6748_06375 [Calditrichaeota bacterium]|nr:MAG: hypothetical protein D6748_06375 [Calditrichota bacterium]
MELLITFFTATIVSLLVVRMVKGLAIRFRIGALPGGRKIHQGFKPVLGGVGILLGLVAGILVSHPLQLLPVNIWKEQLHFWAGLAIIFLTGLIDDIKGISHIQKFLGQILSATFLVLGGCLVEAFYSPSGATFQLGWLGYPFTILWIVFVINAVNLTDGLDGLAAGISLIIMVGFILILIPQGTTFSSVMAIALVGSLLGFLKYNYHPASIFMGDVGSLTLGYLLAYYSIEALSVANTNQLYFLASLVFLGMPLTDTLIAFFRRMGKGAHPFKPDREHIHHRLIKLGVAHLDTVWLMYYITMVYVVLGILMVYYMEITGTILFWAAFAFSIFLAWRLGYLETRRFITFGTEEQETLASLRPLVHVNRIWHQIALIIGDLIAVFLAFYLTYWFRFHSGMIRVLSIKSLQDYLAQPVFLVFLAFWLSLFWLNGLYRMPWDVSRFDKAVKVTRVISFGILFLLIFLNLDLLMGSTSKTPFNQSQLTTLGFYWVTMTGFVNGIRLLIIDIEKRFHLFEYTLKNTIIIGATRKARNIIREISANPHLLYKIVGVVDRKNRMGEFAGYPFIGTYQDLPDLIHRYQVEEIIVALNENNKEDLLNIIGICDRLQVVVKTIPALQAIVSGYNPGTVGEHLIRVFPENMVLWQWAIKRVIDLTFSLLLMITTLPLWIGLLIFLRVHYGKSPLVRVPILGKNARIFNMYLFRFAKDDRVCTSGYLRQPAERKLDAVGDFLFRTNIYKLPQVFNILRGDMSLVGPRPEPPEWYRMYQSQLKVLHRRLMVRPGLTGLAQIRHRFEVSQKSLRERIRYDIFYVENISLRFDLQIILRSVMLFFQLLGKPNRKKTPVTRD